MTLSLSLAFFHIFYDHHPYDFAMQSISKNDESGLKNR